VRDGSYLAGQLAADRWWQRAAWARQATLHVRLQRCIEIITSSREAHLQNFKNSYYANHANAACRIIYRQNLNSVLLLTSNSQIHRPAMGKLKGIPIGTVNRE